MPELGEECIVIAFASLGLIAKLRGRRFLSPQPLLKLLEVFVQICSFVPDRFEAVGDLAQ